MKILKIFVAVLFGLLSLAANAQFTDLRYDYGREAPSQCECAATAQKVMLKGSGGASVVTSAAFPLLAPNGSAAAPSYSWSGFPTIGFYINASSRMSWGAASTYGGAFTNSGLIIANGSSIFFQSSAGETGTIGSGITMDAAGVLAQKDANNAQEFRVYAGNGGFISQVKSVTESLTIAAAATTVGATSIPAGAILLGVSVRVTTIIPTAATFTYATTVGGTTLNTAAVTVAAGSTDPGTAAGASYRAAATTVTITPNLTPGAATGVVRLQYYYLQITPATS